MPSLPPAPSAPILASIAVLLLGPALCAPASISGTTPMLLDDFDDGTGLSTHGTRWSAFTDRVMGGVSTVRVDHHSEGGEGHLHMKGEVSLENNGGFVQMALPLADDGRGLDASAFRAIRLRVRGNGLRYYVHLRTSDTRAPWQYYAASFRAEDEWAEVEIPFAAFRPAALRTPLDRSRLLRVGLVAAKERMQADLRVSRLELVP